MSELESYRVTQRPELILTFCNGCELSLVDHQTGYQSFVIYTDDGSCLAVRSIALNWLKRVSSPVIRAEFSVLMFDSVLMPSNEPDPGNVWT